MNLYMRDMNRFQSLERTEEENLPITELNDTDCNAYQALANIIAVLSLDETHRTALECRMNGLSYPEIARIIYK